MAIYRIACYKCKETFLFDGDNYKQETTTRLFGDAGERIIRFCDHCGVANMIKVDPHAKKGETVDFPGGEASKDDVDAVNKGQSLIRDAPDRIDSLANGLITLDTGLVTVYTTALSFLKVSDNLGSLPYKGIFMALPIIFWLASVFFSVQVYSPRMIGYHPSSPESIKTAMKDIADRKLPYLKYGFVTFFIALIIGSIIMLLGSIGNTPQASTDLATVQFIVSDDQAALFKAINVPMIEGTMKTTNVTLVDTKDGNYIIQVPGDGRNITFNQRQVKGVIYF
jgi:hypothetical protein